MLASIRFQTYEKIKHYYYQILLKGTTQDKKLSEQVKERIISDFESERDHLEQ